MGQPVKLRPPADDLRRPAFVELLLGVEPDLLGETSRPRTTASRTRQLMGLLWPVAFEASVTSQFPADRARRPVQQLRDFTAFLSLLTPAIDLATLITQSRVCKTFCLLPCFLT
jgi:hypothetical protein